MFEQWLSKARFTSCTVALLASACGDDDAGGSGEAGASMTDTSAETDAQGTTTTAATDSQGGGTSGTTGVDTGSDTGSDEDSTTGSASTDDEGSTDTGSTGDTTGGSEEDSSSEDTAGPGVIDQDGDGIPDDADPFPNDPDLPGQVTSGLIYAHSSSVLWTMEVSPPYALQQVGQLGYQSNAGQMTDIAIDQWGVLYGVTFNDLFACHPQQAMCYRLAGLPQSFNGLTMIPAGYIEVDTEVLVAIANSGAWYRVDLVGPQMAQLTQIGSYGGSYTSSGDAFSILGVGTFGAVNGSPHDRIVEVNPSNGNVISEVATVTGYNSIYGLAGWANAVFAFDATSAVLRIDPNDGSVEVIHASTNASWWGAGVGTVLPQ